MVIDEAAAIPLPLVKSLLGPYLVFMASTINGYEGTGRSLSNSQPQQVSNQNSLIINSNQSDHSLVLTNQNINSYCYNKSKHSFHLF